MAAAAIVAEENNVAALMVDYEVVVYDKGEVNDLYCNCNALIYYDGWAGVAALVAVLASEQKHLVFFEQDGFSNLLGGKCLRGLDKSPDLRR